MCVAATLLTKNTTSTGGDYAATTLAAAMSTVLDLPSPQQTEAEEENWDILENGSDSSDSDDENLDDDVETGVSFEDPLCPVIHISRGERKMLCEPWRKAIIVKLLGMQVGLKFMKTRLSKLWRPKQAMEVIDLLDHYFVVRFSDMEDRKRVFEEGPWMIADHYLVVQRWRPMFFPMADKLERVVVWIRISGLPVECYDDNCVLWSLGNAVGKSLKIDKSSAVKEMEDDAGKWFSGSRGKSARLCVEIDIGKVLVSSVTLHDREFPVEYEGLHLVCFSCGRYGHKQEACALAMNIGKLSLTSASKD